MVLRTLFFVQQNNIICMYFDYFRMNKLRKILFLISDSTIGEIK